MLKNRFRIFKAPLNQNGVGKGSAQRQSAKIIEACLVLHNILIELKDQTGTEGGTECDDNDQSDRDTLQSNQTALDLRDRIKDYLFQNQV
jgi:hypothetical protein